MTKHVLVTGGAGFIGSHLVDAYLARGWRVSIIDDLSTGVRANVNPAAEFHEADLADPAAMAIVERIRPDVISHHAAQIDVRKSVADPAFDAMANIVASIRLLHKAHELGVERVLFASSGGALYGEPVIAPQPESHPALPLSPYGCAKLSVEHYLHYFREVHGLESVALRYANVYGPRQNAHGEAGVVAIFANRLLAGEPVTINGTGEQQRDFVFVSDVVRANMAASEIAMSGAYNVGTGVETSVNEIYALMTSILGIDREPIHAPAKAGEQLRSVIDATKLRDAAGIDGFVPLRDGMETTLAWFRSPSAPRL
ncbi:MAG TPA: NAD-dependent epimerase/dehydratase family protein [Thermoanaerobaculia bacterium]|nr:NAD-dependent epimerase/dehydratase family protein [Thermoanaerobaculia bacterium]